MSISRVICSMSEWPGPMMSPSWCHPAPGGPRCWPGPGPRSPPPAPDTSCPTWREAAPLGSPQAPWEPSMQSKVNWMTVTVSCHLVSVVAIILRVTVTNSSVAPGSPHLLDKRQFIFFLWKRFNSNLGSWLVASGEGRAHQRLLPPARSLILKRKIKTEKEQSREQISEWNFLKVWSFYDTNSGLLWPQSLQSSFSK